MSFNGLTDILKKVRERYPALSKRMDEAQAVNRWELAVGPTIAKYSRALRVQETTLWVEVDHPAWQSELHHRKHQIMQILNDKLDPAHQLQDILFINSRTQR